MYFTEFKNCMHNSGESTRDYACRLQKLYSFAYPTEAGKSIEANVLKLRETILMDGFLGGLKPNLRERMSFKDYRNLNDLVKATEKCAAILNVAKLEKRSVDFVNAVSAKVSTQELRETKNEIAELKSVIGQLSQKMIFTQLADNGQSINDICTELLLLQICLIELRARRHRLGLDTFASDLFYRAPRSKAFYCLEQRDCETQSILTGSHVTIRRLNQATRCVFKNCHTAAQIRCLWVMSCVSKIKTLQH
ncbi:hypothetical protein OUZ56_016607 [Daphnia magna]|uniref:Retrotransposon gag domain-containing protein n=1 Tax=Daphnia magna TaxID=35525 RepID=A0ABR0AR60_9CRUS|nr:hypothetical protein OUZ56_016607 [Daphnia magna]